MSVLAILPPVISAVKFVYSRRWDLLHSVRRLLRLCRAGVMYLVNCIKPALARDTRLPSTRPISLSPRLALQEVSVTFPNPSPPLTLTHTHSPRDILPEESQQPEDRTLSLPDLPIQPGSQRDRALPKLPQSSSSLVVDVPLAVVHDIILTYRYGTITIESVESICALHGLSPLIMESILQAMRGDLPPVREQGGYVVSRSLSTRD